MKYYCNACRTEMDLKRDRISGKYLYGCTCCNKHLKKADMITDKQLAQRAAKVEEQERADYHYCSSCDAYVPIDEMDNCGRCERCQEQYPFDEE